MKIPKWEKFQHYKHRKPPWIRLYRELLEDHDWVVMPDDAKALLCELWMVASDTDDGSLPDSTALAWRLRRSEQSIVQSISRINKKFLEDASTVLAERSQHAAPEESTEQSRVRVEGEENAPKESVMEAVIRLDGSPIDEIPCPGCSRVGFLRQSQARGTNPPGFWCHRVGGCGANWPIDCPDIIGKMTSRGQKAVQALGKPPNKERIIYAAEALAIARRG